MPLFTYKATDHATAASRRGTIAAETPRQARDVLRARGLVVRDLLAAEDGDEAPVPGASAAAAVRTPVPRRRRAWWSSPAGGRGVRSRGLRPQVTGFVRELATLLNVGVPLHEALDALGRQGRGRFRRVVLQLRERVAAGAGLADAMREQPAAFDEFCHSIAAVGEDAGTLDASLDRLADFRERADAFRNRIGTALVYPAIVMCMAVFAALFLMTFVVPRVLEPLLEQNLPLPFPTRVVKGASDFLLDWWWLLLTIVVVLTTAGLAAVRTTRGRRAWHGLILRLPVLGPIARKQGVVRVAVVLSTLLRSGVEFLTALRVARRTVGNVVLAEALARAERAVAAGGDIAAALDETAAFPPTLVQVVAVGQQAGRLEDVLDRLAAAYDAQVTAASARLAAVLEPALIVALAGVVLFIILATVLPILEAGNAIG